MLKEQWEKKLSFPYLPQPQRNKLALNISSYLPFIFCFHHHSSKGSRYGYNYLPFWSPFGLFFWMSRQTLAGIILLRNAQKKLKKYLAGPNMLVSTWNTPYGLNWVKENRWENTVTRNQERSWGGSIPSAPKHASKRDSWFADILVCWHPLQISSSGWVLECSEVLGGTDHPATGAQGIII